ncbi:hypothetical protein EJ110_NYTH01035 [Nymphaea thermarum]|nr:hypothetical protein EJ110_NYTH01035 [Nymphaea thermarum]
MKRKKWTEEEEETLINKYSEMVASGALAKLRTREKKFLPICAHVNSTHHALDPQTFPWEWTWRDISIKIQNMRHQYMGVKQKIRRRKKRRKNEGGGGGDVEGDDADEYDWEDGVNHWQNFLRYKEVFGDVDLGEKSDCLNEDSDVLALGWDGDGLDGENELLGDESNREDAADHIQSRRKRWKKDSGWRARVFSLLCTHLLEIRDLMVRREERERERDRVSDGSGGGRQRGFECEERESLWEQRAVERELRVERELEEERQRRMRMEEKKEREEMEWRERMVSLQMEHEKQMMQMHADACQNQMQILGVLVRLMYQLFGSGGDGLGGLNSMPSQVLQAMHHPEGMVSAEEKPEAHSAADFIVDD